MKTLAVVALALASAGCVTRRDMENQPFDAGLKATYKAPFDKTRIAVMDSIVATGFKFKKEAPIGANKTQIYYSHGITATSAGAHTRATVIEEEGKCDVYLLIQSKIENRDTQLQDSALAQDLHDQIEKRLK